MEILDVILLIISVSILVTLFVESVKNKKWMIYVDKQLKNLDYIENDSILRRTLSDMEFENRQYKRHEEDRDKAGEKAKKYEKTGEKRDDEERFVIVGAGNLILSKSPEWQCGKGSGFRFGVSWGEFGESGGVIHKSEALKLAEFIQDSIGDQNSKDFNN